MKRKPFILFSSIGSTQPDAFASFLAWESLNNLKHIFYRVHPTIRILNKRVTNQGHFIRFLIDGELPSCVNTILITGIILTTKAIKQNPGVAGYRIPGVIPAPVS